MPSSFRSAKLRTIDVLKRLARPITQHRYKIEKARYRGRQILSASEGNDALRVSLERREPAAVGKIGGTEMMVINEWLRNKAAQGDVVQTWKGTDLRLHRDSGVYPMTNEVMSRFASEFLKVLPDVDYLAAWYRFGEASITKACAPQATLMELNALEPYYHGNPWSSALEGLRVLVFSPFAKSIESQYARREEVWAAHPSVMPAFTLSTMRAPLYPHMVAPSFPTWFDALEEFKKQIDQREYDVLITGAGAWSVPLAAHAKRKGKWGIHLGGSTQILFGIRGKRWDSHPSFQRFFNDAWIRPAADEKPGGFQEVENGCYW